MNNVTFIFVNAGRTYTDRMVAWLINAFEHGETFAEHVAIQFDYLKGYGPCILEAIASGVVLSPYEKYDDVKKIYKITLDLTEEQYTALENKAVEIAEHKYSYGYKSCLIGGIADSFSRRLARLLAKITNAANDNQMDCSETGLNLLKAAFPDFLSEDDTAQVTPFRLYMRLIIDIAEGDIKASKIQIYKK